MRAITSLVVGVALAVLLAACGGGDGGDDEASEPIVQLDASILPGSLAGLTVAAEDVGEQLADVRRSYVAAAGFYSLREGELLQGTIQVTQLNDEADASDERFQRAIVTQIGSAEPREFRMGTENVFLTSATKQIVAVFFEGDNVVVLSTREGFDRPRTLLREALELEL